MRWLWRACDEVGWPFGPLDLYMLKTRLERCGDFEVLAAEDSEQGRKLAVTEHPDVSSVAW